ncbi:hypothetical protein [Bifidobacterium pseudocatenulatum]|uniref:hypothetical protein n=1 Tax=Bifidobacterium pseudocatenulatum TaxID=28026 RepID=UPI0022E71461|nr:hypothetical protein [Bifidobacterium pseudocatenulatum]
MVDSALKIIRNRKYLLILIATCLIMHFCALADLLLQANVSMNLINIFMIIISLIPLGIIAFSASMRQLDNSCHLVRFAIPLRFVESSAGGIHDVMHDGDWGAWLLSSWAKVWRLPLWWRE